LGETGKPPQVKGKRKRIAGGHGWGKEKKMEEQGKGALLGTEGAIVGQVEKVDKKPLKGAKKAGTGGGERKNTRQELREQSHPQTYWNRLGWLKGDPKGGRENGVVIRGEGGGTVSKSSITYPSGGGP